MDIMNKVKEIRLYKDGIVHNSHHKRSYVLKKYMEIEFFNGKIIRIDMEANADITACDYLVIRDKGKLKKTIFKNELA